MRVEQVMFRSGAARRAGDFYFRTAPTASRRQSRNTITVLHPVPAAAADFKRSAV